MKRYQPTTPRTIFGFASVAMTALTIGVLVVGPAQLDARDGEPLTLAKALQRAPATEVAISPAHVEVVAVRERETAFERFRSFLEKARKVG